MQTHIGEKPYLCFHCSKSFAEKNALTRHILTHTEDKPYPCVLCDKAYSDNSGFKNISGYIYTG